MRTLLKVNLEFWVSGKQGKWCMIRVNGGECLGHSVGDVPLTLMRSHICWLSWLYKALERLEFVYGQAYNFKDIKGEIYFSFEFELCFISTVVSFMA